MAETSKVYFLVIWELVIGIYLELGIWLLEFINEGPGYRYFNPLWQCWADR
jgi:hypothetical protein